MKKKGFLGYRQYVIAGLLIALAAVGTTALYSSRQEKEREQMEAELAEEMQKQADDIAAEESSEQSAEASALVPPKQSLNEMENELDDPAVTAELAEENNAAETEETDVPDGEAHCTSQAAVYHRQAGADPAAGRVWTLGDGPCGGQGRDGCVPAHPHGTEEAGGIDFQAAE